MYDNITKEIPLTNSKEKKEEQEQENKYAHIKEKIGFCVIGTGQRLTHLLRYLLTNHAGLVELIAICDESEVAMKSCVDAYGDDYENI